MNESENSEGERCVLCLDPKRSPVHIQCGHSFCAGCLDIYKSYKQYPWANKCPICRKMLKEKRRAVKRKYTDQSLDPNNAPNSFVRAAETNSTSSLLTNRSMPSQQNHSLEEFMILATSYFDEGIDDTDNYYDSYENMDDSVPDSAQYYEATQMSGASHNEGELNISTDTEYDNYDDYDNYEGNNEYDNYDEYGNYDDFENNNDYDNYDNYDNYAAYDNYADNVDYEDDDEDDSYYYEDDDYSHDADGYHSGDHDYYDSEEPSYIVVDAVTVAPTSDPYNIDWETVIASDVIIID